MVLVNEHHSRETQAPGYISSLFFIPPLIAYPSPGGTPLIAWKTGPAAPVRPTPSNFTEEFGSRHQTGDRDQRIHVKTGMLLIAECIDPILRRIEEIIEVWRILPDMNCSCFGKRKSKLGHWLRLEFVPNDFRRHDSSFRAQAIERPLPLSLDATDLLPMGVRSWRAQEGPAGKFSLVPIAKPRIREKGVPRDRPGPLPS